MFWEQRGFKKHVQTKKGQVKFGTRWCFGSFAWDPVRPKKTFVKTKCFKAPEPQIMLWKCVLGWGKLKSGPKKSSWLRFYEFPKIFASFLAIFGHVGQLCEILSQKNERWHQLLTLPYHFRHIKECFGHTGITKVRLKPKKGKSSSEVAGVLGL